MNVFVLSSRVPYPLEKGDKLRIYHQIRQLSQHFKVTLCCLDADNTSQEAIDHLKTICHRVEVIPLPKWKILFRMAFATVSTRPFQCHYFLQRKARRRVHELINEIKPDHLYCQLIRVTEYVKHIHHIPKTLDYMDAFNKGMERQSKTSKWYLRPIWHLEARKLVKYENLIFDYFEHHTIISEQDQKLIYHPHRKQIKVVPNGVDIEFFTPKKVNKEFDMVFTGNMSYPPNVDTAVELATRILPMVKEEFPQARLLIAGARPNSRVKALQSKDVKVTGWVDDIREAYASGQVFAAPMRIGTGLQNKLLEAMSMGIPCVTSSLANNALHAIDEKQVFVAGNPYDQAAAIVRLLHSAPERSELGQNGRRFVEDNYSWKAATTELIDIIRNY
ncbi:MAG: glycosyltransferase [Flavobacteriales bacterium]|nr:glycosyltransferase [Flavobacteriales bacterium]